MFETKGIDREYRELCGVEGPSTKPETLSKDSRIQSVAKELATSRAYNETEYTAWVDAGGLHDVISQMVEVSKRFGATPDDLQSALLLVEESWSKDGEA